MKQIDLLLQPRSMASAIFTTIEVLSLANMMEQNVSPNIDASPFAWRTVNAMGLPRTLIHPVSGESGYDAFDAPDDSGSDVHGMTAGVALVVPPVRASNFAMLKDVIGTMSDAAALIRERYAEGAIIATSGSGIGLVASAGILDNKRVVVPWHLQPWFAEAFPRIVADAEADLSHHDRILCARAPAHQTLLMLALFAELGANALADRLRKLVLPEHGMLSTMADMVASGVTPILNESLVHKAVQWMRDNLHHPITLDDIASATCTTRRTLLRHFEQHSKLTPYEHLMTLRIERAKLLLAISHQSVLEIANVCGYRDLRAFRRAFRSHAGVSPSDYRKADRLRPESRRWRANELSSNFR